MNTLITRAFSAVKELRNRMFSFDAIHKNVEAVLFTATVRGVLLYHVHCVKRLVTYGDLADATKSLPKGGQLAQALQRIAEDDHQAKRPISTAIVVSKDDRIPGEGFFRQCVELGYAVGLTPEERLLFWRKELDKLGVVAIVNEAPNNSFFQDLEVNGQNLVRDGEVGVLSNLWDKERNVPIKADEIIHTKLGLRTDFPGPVIPPMSVEEQRAKVLAQSPFVYVPAHHLKEGDVLIDATPEGGEVKVLSVDITTVFKDRRSLRRVSWKNDKGQSFSSDELIHFKVKRAEPEAEKPASKLPGETKRRARLRVK